MRASSGVVMGSRRLTLYLLRETVQDFHEALAPDKPSTSVALAPSAGVDGRFHYVSPPQTTPAWVAFLQPLLAEQLVSIRSSSASGLLLVRASGRLFALTFGYGRSLLDLSKIEYQFGLRVTLNRVDPRQLRSLDTKTFEDIVVSTSKQLSQSGELPAFDVEISTDILRAVTGEPRDRSFAKRLSGSDALVMNVTAESADLGKLCEELLIAFAEDNYKTDFAWIDQLGLVRDAERIDTLNEALIQSLRAGDVSTTHLAMPEPIGWEDIDEFKIGGTRGHVYDELDLSRYLEELGPARDTLTYQQLKTRHVSVRFARSESFDKRWNLYQCLVSEHRLDGTLYVLIEGRWFQVSETLVEQVDTYVSALPTARAALIPAKAGESEGDYNERLALSSPRLLNLDARIRRPQGASSGIELCDVLTADGEFIHVKRKARSATLSHLFAQGTVSARTFFSDALYRDKIRDVIATAVADDARVNWLDLVPPGDQPVDRSRYRVTYAVVTNSTRAGNDWLPFFSKLNLMQQGRQIEMLGFKVAISRVPVEG